jgi:hypothetical protein
MMAMLLSGVEQKMLIKMKKLLCILLLFVSVSAFSQGNFFWSHRYGLPKIFTLEPSGVGSTTATGGAIVQDLQGCPIVTIGIIASNVSTPTLQSFTNVVYATASTYFTGQFTGLLQNTLYLYRAFIYTGYEFVYGDVKYFTTGQAPPTLYHNESTNYTFYRSNCAEGYFPDAYTFNVAHATCNETSQALADQCAATIAAANGQAAADANGTCSQGTVYHNAGTSSSVQHTGCGYSCVGTYVTYSVAHNTYTGQISQAAADALEASDLAAQIATNQGSCIRPTGLYMATFYYRGSGVTWTSCAEVIDAAGSGGFTCDNGQCSSFTGQSTLTEGAYVYPDTGTGCYVMQDGFYVVEYNGTLEPWQISGGKLYYCYI